MILAGINLWYFPFNLFPYLHSSQVKNWYNFSNIRKTSLDILLEELKWDTLPNTRIEPIQSKVLQILEKEQILKTLYTPKTSILIDKNIKNTQLKEYIPNKSIRSEILSNMYILDKKIINFENKSLKNFLSFLIKKLND
jgi:RAB protein geranylgeranyltransferase component A